MGNTESKPENCGRNFNTSLNIIILNSGGEIRQNRHIKEIRHNNAQRRSFRKLEHELYGWKFYEFGRNITPIILNQIRKNIILTKNHGLKDNKWVVIYFDKNGENLDIEIIKCMAEIPFLDKKLYSECDIPLLLFISENKNEKDYRKKLKDLMDSEKERYYMDELNITSLKYNGDLKLFWRKLTNELWQDTIYYNRIPSTVLPMDEDDDKINFKFRTSIFTLNFLLAGKAGTGKSTCINILQGRKIAYQSNSYIDATNTINEYLITFDKNRLDNLEESAYFSYKFIDTLGFSTDNKESELLLNCIKNYNSESVKQKDRIHYILYFIKDSDRERIISDVIVEFFKFVVQQKIKIIFVINFNNNKSHECKNILMRELNKKLNKTEYNFLIEPNGSNIIELCLKQYEDIKPFGLNKLMEKLESFFIGKKINSMKLEKAKSKPFNSQTMNPQKASEYLNVLKQYEFFNDLNTIEDLCEKCIYQAKKVLYYTFPILTGLSWIPIPGLDDVLAISIESSLVRSIGDCFGIKIKLEDIPRIFKDINFSSAKGMLKFTGKFILRVGGIAVDCLKIIPPFGYVIGGLVSSGINITSAWTTGNQAIAYFVEKFKTEQHIIYILDLYSEYNKSIDGLSYLKNYFE